MELWGRASVIVDIPNEYINKFENAVENGNDIVINDIMEMSTIRITNDDSYFPYCAEENEDVISDDIAFNATSPKLIFKPTDLDNAVEQLKTAWENLQELDADFNMGSPDIFMFINDCRKRGVENRNG